MRTLFVSVAVAMALMLLPQPARAQLGWFDDFEAYPLGGIHGQGGWRGWDGDPAADAFVTDQQAFDGTQSLLIRGNSDIVQQYSGYTSGKWSYVAMTYVPSDMVAPHYFILLNTYSEGGAKNWSTQVQFDAVNGVVHSDFDGAELPLITDEWVDIVVEIDLDNDVQTFYYGGQVLYTKSWSDGVSGGGQLNIAAVDLFGNGGSGMYFDTLALARPEPVRGTGDSNCDGRVDAFDIEPFLLALFEGRDAWEAQFPCDFLEANDMNGDGAVNAFDIELFIVAIFEPPEKCEIHVHRFGRNLACAAGACGPGLGRTKCLHLCPNCPAGWWIIRRFNGGVYCCYWVFHHTGVCDP